MSKSSSFWMLPALICSIALPCSADNTQKTEQKQNLPGEIVVRTPEDIARGKQNVANVVAELRQLLIPADKQKRKTPVKEDVYLQVVPAADGKANLIYRIRYATSENLSQAIDPMLSSDGNVEFAAEQNLLLINDRAENINALAKAIPLIDVASPQVLIEAKVVEVTLSDGMQRNLSVAFTKDDSVRQTVTESGAVRNIVLPNSAGFRTSSLSPQGTSDGGKFDWVFEAGSGNIETSFQWLLNAQDAKVLSSPTILVARNEESVISHGEDVPIQSLTNTNGSIQTSTTFKRVGVTLTVTPMMLNADNVTLKVEPQVSNVNRYETIQQGEASYQVPVISIRNISTFVKMADGQTVVMGGLFNHRESMQQERIPILSDLPLIGELFTSKYSSKELLQLLFFLKVRILTADDLADGILFDPEETASTSTRIGEIIRNAPSMPKQSTTATQLKREFIDRTPVRKQPAKPNSQEAAKAAPAQDSTGNNAKAQETGSTAAAAPAAKGE